LVPIRKELRGVARRQCNRFNVPMAHRRITKRLAVFCGAKCRLLALSRLAEPATGGRLLTRRRPSELDGFRKAVWKPKRRVGSSLPELLELNGHNEIEGTAGYGLHEWAIYERYASVPLPLLKRDARCDRQRRR
jgi:hypothetical protein